MGQASWAGMKFWGSWPGSAGSSGRRKGVFSITFVTSVSCISVSLIGFPPQFRILWPIFLRCVQRADFRVGLSLFSARCSGSLSGPRFLLAGVVRARRLPSLGGASPRESPSSPLTPSSPSTLRPRPSIPETSSIAAISASSFSLRLTSTSYSSRNRVSWSCTCLFTVPSVCSCISSAARKSHSRNPPILNHFGCDMPPVRRITASC
mmetsp:Transcript_4380/g.12422  ORF Transcript_4380/g.12422 Transcript_4380/m.12422 type:complete len:207 (-) Transcript_4380:56-676(-)